MQDEHDNQDGTEQRQKSAMGLHPGNTTPHPDKAAQEQAEQVRASVLSVGSVLSRSQKILRGNFVLFSLLSLVSILPDEIWGFFVPSPPDYVTPTMTYDYLFPLLSNAVAPIIQIPLGLLVEAVITYCVFQAAMGRQAGLGEALRRGLSNFWALLLASLLLMLLLGLGLVLLVIPAIIIYCMYSVIVQACVMEGLGPVQSLTRSAELTRGNRWKIFAIFFVIILICAIVGCALFILLEFLTQSSMVLHIGGIIVQSVVTAFVCVACTVIYFDLRTSREGVEISALARVFD